MMKADTEVIAATFGCGVPAVGESIVLCVDARSIRFWRMPSTSRAYPLKLEKKAEAYRRLFPEKAVPSQA